MLIKVRVKTGSKKFSMKFDNDFLLVSLTEQPENNKANTELIKKLTKKLGPCRIMKGLHSKNKVLEIDNLKQKTHA